MAKTPAKIFKRFDLDDPKLPRRNRKAALGSGGYPYDKRLKRKPYEKELGRLQSELLKLQDHVQSKGRAHRRPVRGARCGRQGRDHRRVPRAHEYAPCPPVALNKPSDVERGQWYFQRYIAHLPTAGDIVFFDRSWYNRAGVERVMGFCSADEVANFLRDVARLRGAARARRHAGSSSSI